MAEIKIGHLTYRPLPTEANMIAMMKAAKFKGRDHALQINATKAIFNPLSTPSQGNKGAEQTKGE